MTSNEIFSYIHQNKVDDLYKKFISYFQWLDEWSDKTIKGDILNETDLVFMLDRSTAIFSKLCPVVNALESYQERILYTEESKFYKGIEHVKAQDTAIAKAHARASVSDIRDYVSDFKSYLMAAQQNITTAQSRLKRLVVEGGAKKVGYYGEPPVQEPENNNPWN